MCKYFQHVLTLHLQYTIGKTCPQIMEREAAEGRSDQWEMRHLGSKSFFKSNWVRTWSQVSCLRKGTNHHVLWEKFLYFLRFLLKRNQALKEEDRAVSLRWRKVPLYPHNITQEQPCLPKEDRTQVTSLSTALSVGELNSLASRNRLSSHPALSKYCEESLGSNGWELILLDRWPSKCGRWV